MSVKTPELIFNCSPLLAGRGNQRSDFIQISQLPSLADDCCVLLTISNPYSLRENVSTWVDYHTGDWKKAFRFALSLYQTIIYEFPLGLAPENAISKIFQEINEWKANFEICGVKFEYFFWNLDLIAFGYEIDPEIIENFVQRHGIW